MRKNVMGRVLLTAFGGAMTLCGPSVPAVAQTTENCYEVILYCKYHQGPYGSFQACLDYNRDSMCPPDAAAAPPALSLVAVPNTQMKDHV